MIWRSIVDYGLISGLWDIAGHCLALFATSNSAMLNRPPIPVERIPGERIPGDAVRARSLYMLRELC
jgi:hypothetical protein